jgi:hypothetical protein
MARVPMQIPIQIRVRDAGRSPPDVTVEPTCVRASTRDTLEWVLQGAGQFTIEFAEGATPRQRLRARQRQIRLLLGTRRRAGGARHLSLQGAL